MKGNKVSLIELDQENYLIFQRNLSADRVEKLIRRRKLAGLSIRAIEPFESITTLDFLSEYGFLKGLKITAGNIFNYSFLSRLTDLTHLALLLYEKPDWPVDISGLAKLTRLSIMGLNDVQGIDRCKEVTELYYNGLNQRTGASP